MGVGVSYWLFVTRYLWKGHQEQITNNSARLSWPGDKMDILVVEDDPVIGKSLDQGLREAGHGCVWVKDGRRGLEQAQSQKFDAVILDLLLPGEAGLDVLGKLRAQGIKTPVIALTALGSVQERVTGLKTGADDYLVTPFFLAELLARL